jgi:succinate dehydrogenase/fumarate reductase-like Fe-S protein
LMSCTEHCPKHLSPTRAISGLKRATWRLALERDEP